MSEINRDFVEIIARVWHRFSLSKDEASTLSDMLAPMDDAGEDVAEYIQFDWEPSDFDRALEELADPSEMP